MDTAATKSAATRYRPILCAANGIPAPPWYEGLPLEPAHRGHARSRRKNDRATFDTFLIPRMARPRKAKLSRTEIAERAGVSTRTLSAWQKEGVDLSDMKAVLRRAAEVVRLDPADDDKLRAARLRKLELECQRIERTIRREERDFVAMEEVIHAFRVYDTIITALCTEMSGYLPELLNGQPPERMGPILKDAFFDFREKLSREKFCSDHPETRKYERRLAELDRQNLCHTCLNTKEKST